MMTTSNLLPWPLPHISLLTDAQLDELRQEPKKKASSTRQKEKMGHTERQYELVAVADHVRRFRLFVRQSTSNPGVFSAGLSVLLTDGELILCRYNSGHHGHRNILEKVKLPAATHLHVATQRYIAQGLDPDGFAIQRADYDSVAGALALLVQECNIEGVLDPSTQSDLFPK